MKMIPVSGPFLGEEELNNVIEAVKSGWVSSKGKFIPEFEQGFAAFCGMKHGIATSNGTTALHLALVALGIGPGDEVIVPTLTFVATANAVVYTGAKPVFVDSHPDYWNIDPRKIEEKINPKTRALLVVHLYGHPCDMNPIKDIARKHKLYLLEDVAEAHGAEYRGKKAGSFSDISCFSFYGNKIITTGEGGMCLTSDLQLAEKMRLLRDHGMNPNKRYWHDFIGFNYRMTNMQAALGVAQLGKIDKLIGMRQHIAEWYVEGLKDAAKDGLVTLHPQEKWAKCIFWIYSILISKKVKMDRDTLIDQLYKKGIETRPLFYPVHVMPMYQAGEHYPVAEEISARGISLPSSPDITREEVKYVTETIKAVIS